MSEQRQLDGFLTRKARDTWAKALVFVRSDGTHVLELIGEDGEVTSIQISSDRTPEHKRFREAREGLTLLSDAMKS